MAEAKGEDREMEMGTPATTKKQMRRKKQMEGTKWKNIMFNSHHLIKLGNDIKIKIKKKKTIHLTLLIFLIMFHSLY